MQTKKFKSWLKSLENLNTLQERILKEQLETKANRKHVSRTLETPYDQVFCPYCQSKDFTRWGKRNDLQRYRCKSCKKTFNSLTGTPLAHLQRKGHWLDYAQCLKEGLSIRKAAKRCNIHPNTAFRWRHRFLQKANTIRPTHLEGIVEAREAFFRKSEKGTRNLKRTPHKRSKKYNKSRRKQDYVCVFVSRDRNRNTTDAILENFEARSIQNFLTKYISKDALFCSESLTIYKKVARSNQIRHGTLNLSKGETVKKDIVHIQHVNQYQKQFKEWIYNHFHGVATKYLHNYLSWHREQDEFNFNIPPQTLLLRAKSGGEYKSQPQLITSHFSPPISP